MSKQTLYIVDALNFLYRAFHALPPLTAPDGTPTGAIYGLCNMLLRLERERTPSHLVVVQDAPGPSFRKDIFSDYKGTRPPMPPELKSQLGMVGEALQALGINRIQIPGVEADDTIASIALSAADQDISVFVCSSDKDLMQLCGPNIQVYDTMKGRVFGADAVQDKFGVSPAQLGDLLALMGDKVDNIPGVPGIGPKTAASLLGTYGSLESLLDQAGNVPGKKGVALVEHAEAARTARSLVALKTDVDFQLGLDDLRAPEPDLPARNAFFKKVAFSRLVEALPQGLAEDAPDDAVSDASNTGDHEPALSVAAPRVISSVDDAERLLASLAGSPATAKGDPARIGLAFAFDENGRGDQGVVGVAVAWLDRNGTYQRAYLPCGHRRLDAPAQISEATLLKVFAPVLGTRLAVASDDADDGSGSDASCPPKVVMEAKRVGRYLRQHGLRLGRVTGDPVLAGYLLDSSRGEMHLGDLWAQVGMPPMPDLDLGPRKAWLGTGKTAKALADCDVSLVAERLSGEAVAALALDGPQRAALEEGAQLGLYDEVEMPLAEVLGAMEAKGICVDVPSLSALSDELSVQVAQLESEIHTLAGAFNVASPKQLAKILFETLGLPVIKKTKTGPSTDADVLEQLSLSHAVPEKVLSFRTLVKLKNTYIDALPGLVHTDSGRIQTTYNQAVAATGRLSSRDPNLQNIPIRTALGRRIRAAFVAPPNRCLVAADYSQIELRVLAHFSGDTGLVEAFQQGQDVHARTASEIFGCAIDAVDRDQRRIAKAINFGLVFGQTDFGLARALKSPGRMQSSTSSGISNGTAASRPSWTMLWPGPKSRVRVRPCWDVNVPSLKSYPSGPSYGRTVSGWPGTPHPGFSRRHTESRDGAGRRRIGH